MTWDFVDLLFQGYVISYLIADKDSNLISIQTNLWVGTSKCWCSSGNKIRSDFVFHIVVNEIKILELDGWKYVDDLTYCSNYLWSYTKVRILKLICNMNLTIFQFGATENIRNLTQKCAKNLESICDLTDLRQLTIDETPLETISSHRLSGLQTQNEWTRWLYY